MSSLCSPSLTGSQGRTKCCVGAGAATCAFVSCCLHLSGSSLLPAPHLPVHTKEGWGQLLPHSCYTLILWMEHHSKLCPPAVRLGRGRMLVGPASAMVEGPQLPPLHRTPFSSLPFRFPNSSLLAVGWGSQSSFNSSSRRHHLPDRIAVLSHPFPVPRFPSLAAVSHLSMVRDLAQPFTGTSWRSCPNLVEVLPQMPDSLLPALQLGSGLRHWLGEGFFPGCNFSLLHTVCFEQCLEASHPRLTAGAGECAGCQPSEAPAPDPSSLGEITAN